MRKLKEKKGEKNQYQVRKHATLAAPSFPKFISWRTRNMK